MISRESLIRSLFDLSDPAAGGSRAEVLERMLHAALATGEADGVAVVLLHHRAIERRSLVRGQTEPETVEAPRAMSDLARMLLRSGHPVTLADLSSDSLAGPSDRCSAFEAGPAAFIPLRHHEQSFGYLALYRERGGRRFESDDVRAVSLVAAWTSLSLQNLRLGESLKKLAVTDDLTQVYNFRFLKTALRREIRRAGRFEQKLSIVMIDVDNLKVYNDKNGHMRGSFLLRELAGLFAKNVREFDLVAKYGGDEFTLILPQTDRDGALTVAERMRSVVAGHTFPLTERGAITVSLGVAVFPDDATDPLGLIQASDRALYQAKKSGRNRVTVLGERAA